MAQAYGRAAWIVVAGLAAAALACGGALRAQQAPRAALEAMAAEARALRAPAVVDGIPDYSAAAVARQRDALRDLQARFAALDPAGWDQAAVVDYLLVRADLDLLQYGLHVQRPTSRNPNFYLSAISSAGMLSGPTLSRLGSLVSQPAPFDAARTQRILDHLRAIPRILAQARANLTEPDAHLARWALESLTDARANSVRFGDALAPHVPASQAPEVKAAAAAMGDALEQYAAWLRDRLPRMAPRLVVGRELYDWLLRRVWLVPLDADRVRAMGDRELSRFVALTTLEEGRNAALPPPRPAATTAEYIDRTVADEARIRAWLTTRRLLTIPPTVGGYGRAVMPDYLQAFPLWNGLSGYSAPGGRAVKYAVPETHPYSHTYWEAIMRADPSTNIFHDGIPGHHFQGLVIGAHANPIRRDRRERFLSEGWCTYWEEAAVELGFYDDRPRSRELMLSYLRLRAWRVLADVDLALGRMEPDEATRLLMRTPTDERIAREEADDFAAAPTGGLVYLIGKMQIESLLRERRAALGTAFDLGAFHDALLGAGWTPIALIRFEMTGDRTDVARFLADRAPMPAPQRP